MSKSIDHTYQVSEKKNKQKTIKLFMLYMLQQKRNKIYCYLGKSQHLIIFEDVYQRKRIFATERQHGFA